jgi:hypothetical protein
MNQAVLSEIEQRILELPADEQLLLISRVSEKLRHNSVNESDFESGLLEMAADEDIRKELKEIAADFHETEFDGLPE